MAKRAIAGESSPLTKEDVRKRVIVQKLVQSENKAVVDFAKRLVTTSFSAIGVVLALKEKWLGTSPLEWQKGLLASAITLFLIASLLGTIAAGVYRHRVSLSDYENVDAELHRVANLRYRLTAYAFGLLLLGTIVVAVLAIGA